MYHVKLLPKLQRRMSVLGNNSRNYQIHVNMSQRACNLDVLKSYYMARLIDNELAKKERFNTYAIETSIRHAEREFLKVNFQALQAQLVEKGWSLEYIYLDPKRNRYNIES